jgi:hypothetical protein
MLFFIFLNIKTRLAKCLILDDSSSICIMSYQAPPQYQPAPQQQRIRHDNSMNLDSGTKEILFTLGAIGVGALGAYFLVDYVIKGNFLSPAPGPAEDTQEEGTTTGTGGSAAAANLAVIETQEPFDRTTKVNSYLANAYRGKPAPGRLPSFEIDNVEADEMDEEIEGEDDLAFNQVFTDDRVYDITEPESQEIVIV